MHSDLKNTIETIIQALTADKKDNLAKCISNNWGKTCMEYSKSLNSYRPALPIEAIFKSALDKELLRLGYKKTEVRKISKAIISRRVLQTTPHLSPAQKPRYLFINWLTSLSLSKNDIYPVAMFSGVPFSNKTRPGRLSLGSGDINLIPSALQDALVYRSEINNKTIEAVAKLPDKIKKLLPKIGSSYTAWALRSSEKIESKFLSGKTIFIDFNEVAANYLLLAIENPRHPISVLLFDIKERKKLEIKFKGEVFFYAPITLGKCEVMDSFTLENGKLKGKYRTINITQEELIKEIRNGRLCVGLPLGFLIFAFLNHFKCFGSFAQVEYLPMYQKKFGGFAFLKKYKIEKVPTSNLTTGGFPDATNLHPLDLYLGAKFKPNKNMLFGEAIVTISDVLLHQNYSTNYSKK